MKNWMYVPTMYVYVHVSHCEEYASDIRTVRLNKGLLYAIRTMIDRGIVSIVAFVTPYVVFLSFIFSKHFLGFRGII